MNKDQKAAVVEDIARPLPAAEEIRSIARLPAREVLHGQLVWAVASPLAGLARTLNALVAGVAVQLQQIVEQRAAEEASPAEPEAASSEPETDEPPDEGQAGE